MARDGGCGVGWSGMGGRCRGLGWGLGWLHWGWLQDGWAGTPGRPHPTETHPDPLPRAADARLKATAALATAEKAVEAARVAKILAKDLQPILDDPEPRNRLDSEGTDTDLLEYDSPGVYENGVTPSDVTPDPSYPPHPAAALEGGPPPDLAPSGEWGTPSGAPFGRCRGASAGGGLWGKGMFGERVRWRCRRGVSHPLPFPLQGAHPLVVLAVVLIDICLAHLFSLLLT
uniref:Uncharacterized protein n=1 Tax=Chelydra serpentina TaxID=8475 RepID=A0A8C3XU22_CHESE